MKKIFLLLCLLCAFTSFSQSQEEADKKAIHKVLKKQRLAWSKNNIEEYMAGYWKSDSLKFYSANGVTKGWENTLDRYLKAYPTEDHTGILSFKINDITKISKDAYYVLGEYHIKRDLGNADGIFMLVFKKINGEWKIIADTST
ncbi:nuclear transport factor 2 family protein [Tamlana sp. 2_MG-2023]|uniref:YybH family protein n=1 Tax=unclassified Tamlana TaxID=2614803 RepID=UPI0026E31262|nr:MULTISPECIES: nuclear transport factor 2 family protein [unclassified Tamlana]MDO6761769.1 nuclear transport factor 2 family protein [Tamlana sp. 2_MG-2023]MDO6792530.1 nuclear transport factor 2 family protein [Tamlana sp. 1_MG-2023]